MATCQELYDAWHKPGATPAEKKAASDAFYGINPPGASCPGNIATDPQGLYSGNHTPTPPPPPHG